MIPKDRGSGRAKFRKPPPPPLVLPTLEIDFRSVSRDSGAADHWPAGDVRRGTANKLARTLSEETYYAKFSGPHSSHPFSRPPTTPTTPFASLRAAGLGPRAASPFIDFGTFRVHAYGSSTRV